MSVDGGIPPPALMDGTPRHARIAGSTWCDVYRTFSGYHSGESAEK